MCIYIVRRSFTPKDKAKEVGELTQRVGETTESVNSEQDVGETTVGTLSWLKCYVNKLSMQVVEKLTHVAHTFLLRTKLKVNEQSDLLNALIPKLVLKTISQRYVFSYFHSHDIVPWKCKTLHLKAYKAKYPLTLDFMNFE